MNRRAVDRSGRPGVDEKFSRRPADRPMSVTALLLLVVTAIATLTITGAGAGQRATALGVPDAVGAATAVASADTTAGPDSTTPPVTRPPLVDNDFIPQDTDLTTCVGALERPGCGSESRGGWRQTLVFVVVITGLFVVFGNVARGVVKNRRSQQ